MAYPSENDVVDPLIYCIFLMGGKARPASIYEPLADFFRLSQSERRRTRDDEYFDGKDERLWHNIVQYARLKAVDGGSIERGQRGVWRLSTKGKQKAELMAKNGRYAALRKIVSI